MRSIVSLAVALVIVGAGSMSAQDALSRVLPDDPPAVTLLFENADVAVVLDELASIGGFDVYFTKDVETLPPVSVDVRSAEFGTVLRSVLSDWDVSYRVIDDDTLLVSRAWRVPYKGGRLYAPALRLPGSLGEVLPGDPLGR